MSMGREPDGANYEPWTRVRTKRAGHASRPARGLRGLSGCAPRTSCEPGFAGGRWRGGALPPPASIPRKEGPGSLALILKQRPEAMPTHLMKLARVLQLVPDVVKSNITLRL